MLWLSYVTMALLLVVGILLIFIILLQRGRGGGLAGALGGMGGQSAFGTKAGDLFTRITVVLAVIWIVLGAGLILVCRAANTKFQPGDSVDTVIQTAPGGEDEQRNPFDESADDADQTPDTKQFPDDADEKTDEKSESGTSGDTPAESKSDENNAPESGSEPESESKAKPADETSTDEKPQE